MNSFERERKSERGSARIKLLMVLVVLGVIGNALFRYVPVAYEGATFAQEMDAMVISVATQPKLGMTPVEDAKDRLGRLSKSFGLPANALLEVTSNNDILKMHVAYKQEIPILPFGLYTYEYSFDHVSTPKGFVVR